MGDVLQRFIRRRFEIVKIEAISMSSKCNKFIIHVPSEYDYMFSSDHQSKLIIKTIAMAKIKLTGEKTFKIITHHQK